MPTGVDVMKTLGQARGQGRKGRVGAQGSSVVVQVDSSKGRAVARARLGVTFDQTTPADRHRIAALNQKRLRRWGSPLPLLKRGTLTNGSGTPRLVKPTKA